MRPGRAAEGLSPQALAPSVGPRWLRVELVGRLQHHGSAGLVDDAGRGRRIRSNFLLRVSSVTQRDLAHDKRCRVDGVM